MSANIDIFIDAQEQANGVIRSVIGSLDDLEKGSGNLLTRGLVPLQNMMMTGLKVAAGAATAAIGGLVAGITKSVMAAGDMQQGLADISAAMGASTEETAQLKTLISDLGLDPKLKVTATQAADAIGQLGTAGLSVDQILNGAARSTVLLANATGADFGQAANIATDVMALWGIKAEDLKTAVDGVTSATIASKFNINDYALALAQGGGVAATVGVDFADFNATIATIAPYFSSGADAGTSFKVFLQRLIPQSNEAADTMRKLGLFTGLTGKEYDKTQANLKKYESQLAALDPTTKNYADKSADLNNKIAVLRTSLIAGSNAFFDAEGNMKSMAEITGILNEATKDLSEEAKNEAYSIIFGTDAMRAAAAIAGSTTEQFQALKDTMGKTDAEEAAAKRMDTFKGSVEILGGVFETVSLMIGDKFLPMLTDLVKRFTEFLQGVAPQVVEWAGVFASNLEGLINYIIAVVQDGDTMNDWLTHMHPLLQNIVLRTIEWVKWIQSTIAAIKDILKPIIDVIAQYVSWRDILSVLGAVLSSILIPALLSIVAAMAPVIASLTASIAISNTMRSAWEGNFGGIRDTVGSVLNYLQERFGGLLAAIRTFGSGALTEILAWATGNKTQFTNLLTIWDSARNAVQALFNDIVRYVQTSLPIWTARLGEMATAAWQWIVNATTPTLNKLNDWASSIFSWLQATIPLWIAKFAPMGIALFKWIGDNIPKAIDELTRWIDGMLVWTGSTGTTKTQEMLNKLGAAMLNALGKVGISLANLALTVAGDILIYFAKGLLDFAGIDVSIKTLHDWLTKALDGIKALLSEKAGLVGGALLLALIPGFTGIATAIAGTVIPAIMSLITWIGGSLLSIIGSFVTTLMGGGGLFVSLSSLASTITGTVIPAIMAFLAPFAPILLTIAAVAAAVVGLYLAWQHNFLGIRDFTYSALESIKGFFNGLPAALSNLGSQMYEKGRAIVQSVTDGANAAAPYVYSAGQYVMQRLGEGFAAAREFVSGQAQQVMTDIQERGIGFAAGAFAGRLYEAARNAILKFGEGLLAGSPNIANDFNNVLNGVINTFNNVMNSFGPHVYGVASNIGGKILEGLRAINPAGGIEGIVNSIITAFNQKMDAFKQHVYAVANSIGSFIAQGLQAINLSSVIGLPLDGMIAKFNQVMDGFKAHVKGVASSIGTAITEGLRAVNPGDAMSGALWGIIDAFNKIMDSFKVHVLGVMRDIGGRIGGGLAEGIRNTIAAVTDALRWITDSAPQWIKDQLGIRSPSRVFMDIGENIMAGLTQGIQAMTAAPQQALATATDGLVGAGQTTINNTRATNVTNNFTVPGVAGNDRDSFEMVRILSTLYN